MRRKKLLSSVTQGSCFVLEDGGGEDRPDLVGSVLHAASAYRVDSVEPELVCATNALGEKVTLPPDAGVYPIPRGGYDRLVQNHLKALEESEKTR
jgi:hypothetical protein